MAFKDAYPTMPTAPSGQSFIRPELRQQSSVNPYRVDTTLHRLQWNENPYDFPADLKEEVLQRLAHVAWSRYPVGLRPFDTIDAIAESLKLSSDQIVVGNGSSDMLRVVNNAILQAGDHMLTLSPTFNSYMRHAEQVGAKSHSIALDPAQDFALPVDAILEHAAHHRTKLIVICAPNNPTGTIYPYEQLRRIVLESNAFVLLDAAYAEFCQQDLRPLLAEADNFVLVHTLSKAFTLAGVRIGYTISSAEVAQNLQKLATNFTLSPFTESAAIVAIQHKERFAPLIAAIVAERERLAAALALLPGVRVHPSGTNFLLVNMGQPGKDAQNYLRSHQQVLVSDMAMYPGYENYLRISIGAPEQNDLVVTGLSHYLATVAT